MEIKKSWTDLKSLQLYKDLLLQWDEPLGKDHYLVWASENSVLYFSELEKGGVDAVDFEANHKATANDRLREKATLQSARSKLAVDVNGNAKVTLTVPAGGRVIEYGKGWFETHHNDDFVKVYIKAGPTEVSSYYDNDLAAVNQGYYIPPVGVAELKSLTDTAFLPAGLTLVIEAQKGGVAPFNDVFRVNIKWGKR